MEEMSGRLWVESKEPKEQEEPKTESQSDQTKGLRSESTMAWRMEPLKGAQWVTPQALLWESQTERTWALWEPGS